MRLPPPKPPVLLARVLERNPGHVDVWCTYCKTRHVHAVDKPGTLVPAGCEHPTPYVSTGYILIWRFVLRFCACPEAEDSGTCSGGGNGT